MTVDLAKMAKFCGMLGSEYDGERANAAKFATDVLRSAKVTWQQFVEAAGRGLAPASPPRPAQPSAAKSYRQQAYHRAQKAASADARSWMRYGVGVSDHLRRIRGADQTKITEWEQQFLKSLDSGTFALTERQWWVIERIEVRLGILEPV